MDYRKLQALSVILLIDSPMGACDKMSLYRRIYYRGATHAVENIVRFVFHECVVTKPADVEEK
ncbi:MAG: hypothetical protein M1318_08245, partial [Firmicutes bacterium]|nr:hypothetical protein [Bacillota bacterium]